MRNFLKIRHGYCTSHSMQYNNDSSNELSISEFNLYFYIRDLFWRPNSYEIALLNYEMVVCKLKQLTTNTL